MALAGPFIIKVGVAYMEVPFCRTCRWWWRDELERGDEDTGVCVAGFGSEAYVGHEWPQDREARMWTDCGEQTIRTTKDFGCVQHEPREGHDEGTNDPT